MISCLIMEGYQFYKPSTPQDYEHLYALMGVAFRDEDVAKIVRRFVVKHSEMTHDNYFVIKHGEKTVAGLVLIPQKWSIDGMDLKVAEMGCVATDPAYRRKGLQYILNKRFDKYSKEKGYDLCVLAGIPFFYRQFGYQYAVELDYETSIMTEQLPQGSMLSVRPFKPIHVQEAHRLLEITQKGYMIKSIRTQKIWQIQVETGTYGAEPFKASVFYAGDKMVAYYRWWPEPEEKALVIKELALGDEQKIPMIAASLREEAEKQGLAKVKTKLSHVDAFSRYLLVLGAERNKPYAWQVKILEPVRFLKKIGPVFERRLENSKFKELSGELRMNFWKYAISLRFEGGKLVSVKEVFEAKRVLGMNPYASIQLFLGYRSRAELEHMYPDFYIKGGYEQLIDVLFPCKPSYIHYCY